MKVKIFLFAFLLMFTLCGTAIGEVVNTYADVQFKANVYQMTCNFSTTGFQPMDQQTWVDYGTPGTDWRVSAWNGSGYNRYGEGGNYEPLLRGDGFWFISTIDRADIRFEGELSWVDADPDGYTEINLSLNGQTPGYTMVGNPFNQTWHLSHIDLYDGGDNFLESVTDAVNGGVFNDNFAIWLEYVNPDIPANVDYSDMNLLRSSWHARHLSGWITCNFTEAQLQQRHNGFSPPLKLRLKSTGIYQGIMPEDMPDPKRDEPESGWDLYLAVTSSDGEYQKSRSKLGIREDASEVYDANDINLLSPPVSSYIQVYFPHHEWDFAPFNYIHDIRSMEFDGAKEWDFTVRIKNIENRDFTLDWPTIDEIPENYSLTLFDVDNNRVIGDMRDLGQVAFRTGDGREQEFHYRVVCEYTPEWVGPGSSSLPGGFGLTNAYPNPFNNVVNLEYTLPMNQNASLKVFDMTGKLVDVINGNLQGAGTVSWNANGMQSGVYMMKLISGDQVSLKKVILMQ